MRTNPSARRVIVVVLDGLRSDAIERFDLAHLRRIMKYGSSTLQARTVSPSITTAAMTSLMTGVSPMVHGVTTDRIVLPRAPIGVRPVPELLAMHGYPSSGFMGQVPTLVRGVANRVVRRLGFGTAQFAGKTAPEILLAARSSLRTQRRGLIVLHLPDADRAGHERGWMSQAYEEACHALDGTLGMLHALAHIGEDPSTLLIACADHGGGGHVSNDHNSDHPLDVTIPLLLSGAAIAPVPLEPASLLDIPATVLWALGVERPEWIEGRVLLEAFRSLTAASAVA